MLNLELGCFCRGFLDALFDQVSGGPAKSLGIFAIVVRVIYETKSVNASPVEKEARNIPTK